MHLFGEECIVRVEKVINNNIISSRDEKGIEVIAMGKGIGFGRKPGSEIEDDRIEKIFKLENVDDKEKFKEILASFPIENIRLSNQIISYAKETIGVEMNQNVYLTLTDHIGFAIERQKKNMIFSNALFEEVKLFYPNEYVIGRYALHLIEEQTGYRLCDDEAASIALHIVNAELNSRISTTFTMTKMMREMMQMIEDTITIPEKANYPTDRLIGNLKYLANRLVSKIPVMGRVDEELNDFVKANYPQEYQLIDRLDQHILQTYQCMMTEEEKLYLTLDIKRLKDLYVS